MGVERDGEQDVADGQVRVLQIALHNHRNDVQDPKWDQTDEPCDAKRGLIVHQDVLRDLQTGCP